VVDILQHQVIGEGFEQEIRALVNTECASGKRLDAERVRLKRAATCLELKIDRATENLLVANLKHLDIAVAKVAKWQEQRENLRTRFTNIENSSPKRINARIAEVMCEVSRLRFGLMSSDPALLHHTLQRLIKHITLWFEPAPSRPGCSRLAKE